MLAPTSETDLADAIRTAPAPLRITGGGTRSIGHTTAQQSLTTTGLTGITLYEPGALTIVAKAGTPLAEVEAALAAENQRLPFEPLRLSALLGTPEGSTIGGVVATNASGPRRLQAGACRDSLIGVRFVDGTGQVLKNGGRVMKNVTGYDLVKLLAGSHGTLGVLTEVAFKVLPRTDATATLQMQGLDPAQAVAAMSAGLRSPFEVTGAAHDTATQTTSLRIEGFEASVAYRTKELSKILAPFAPPTVLDTDASQSLWRDIRDVAPLHGAQGDLWRVCVKPSDAPALLAALNADQTLLDWGGGLVWATCAPGTDLRARMGTIQGHATRLRASTPNPPTFHPEAVALTQISAGLRAKFDPRGLLNPGLMG